MNVKPPPDRLYGRARGHKLRDRQRRLLDLVLPRLEFPARAACAPLSAFTGDVRELWLEVGAGGGEHAAAQADSHPEVGLVACEIYVNGLCSLLSRLVPEGREIEAPLPGNLRLWPGDARLLIRALPALSLAGLFLLFPDPWPKARHAKRRFVHPNLIPELARVLQPGAEWRIATDDPTYQNWVQDVLRGQDFFRYEPPAVVRPDGWPPTRYEVKALRAGRKPLYWRLIRR